MTNQLIHSIKPAAKSPIVRSMDPGRTLYQVKSGSAFIMLDDFIVDIVFVDDYIGAEAYLSGGEYQYTVTAHRGCELVYRRFDVIDADAELIRELTIQAAVRADRYAVRLHSMVNDDVPTRVRKCVKMLSASSIADAGGSFRMTLTQIGAYCGCSREAAGRVLSQMKSNGELYSQGLLKQYLSAA